jgi:hypothetical protein
LRKMANKMYISLDMDVLHVFFQIIDMLLSVTFSLSISQEHGYQTLVMIGDGATDLEVS